LYAIRKVNYGGDSDVLEIFESRYLEDGKPIIPAQSFDGIPANVELIDASTCDPFLSLSEARLNQMGMGIETGIIIDNQYTNGPWLGERKHELL
jgi:hypothetical protein